MNWIEEPEASKADLAPMVRRQNQLKPGWEVRNPLLYSYVYHAVKSIRPAHHRRRLYVVLSR